MMNNASFSNAMPEPGASRNNITIPQGSPDTKYAKSAATEKKQATNKEQKAAAIADYIASNDKIKAALATFRKALLEYHSSQNRKFSTKFFDSVHNVVQDVTGGTDYRQQLTFEGALTTLEKNDPAEEVRIKEAGEQLTALYNLAREYGLKWEDVKTAAGKAGIDLNISISGMGNVDEAVKQWFYEMSKGLYKSGSAINSKRTSRTLYGEGSNQSFATVTNGSIALQNSDPKTLATTAVKYDNEAKRVSTELESLAAELQTSVEDLMKKVQSGQPVNEVAAKYVRNLISIKENQEGLAKVVNAIPDGSDTDYKFVEAYKEAVVNDQFVDKGTILPQLGEILKNHPAAPGAEGVQMYGGQEMLNKAKALNNYNVGVR